MRETWYYDDRGRTVRHVKGYPSGSRMTELSGYDFTGELTALGRTMLLSNDAEKTEEYTYTYDDWGRLEGTHHSLDGGASVMLSANSYDAVGRLDSTARGGTSVQDSSAALASAYTYNVRDWLTGIGGSLFSETLTYETPRTGSSLPGQWGGNISSSQWQTSASLPDWKWYDYAYDALGRLTEARFGEMGGESPVDYKSTYEYDLNGNLERRTTLNDAGALANHERETRWTWSQTNGNRPTGWTQRQYDVTILSGTPPRPPQRIYQFDPSGNQEENYSYDPDGNRTATLDPQGDTLNVTAYNRLNLPVGFTTESGDTIRYVYSADGEKLFVKEIPSAGSSTGTEYAANYRLENGSLTMIHTDAGYYTPFPASPGGTGSVYKHLWYLKDHLGNNRVLADGSGDVYAVHHYDPYGGDIPVVSTTTTSSFPFGAKDSPYKYGDKEWNVTTSTYDFEARQLSPAFHRFTTMDPLAEKYYGVSPYSFCKNNPLNYVDPQGLTDWRAVGKGALTIIGGVGTTAGGVALTTGTGGAATPLSAYLVIEGISEIGFGLGILLSGLASENTEEEYNRINQIPTGATNTIAKTLDILTGDENHTIERIADATQAVVTAGTSLQSDISLITKNLVRVSNAISIIKSSTIVTQDTSSSQDNKESSKRKNTSVTSYPTFDDSERDKYYLWKNEQQFSTFF